jgi:glutathione S-transferase
VKLVIGNKNYSSWSLRPWIAMKTLGIPFEEILIPFGAPIGNPDFKAKLAPYTPAGRVPVLLDDDTQVWETLAILNISLRNFPSIGSGRRTRRRAPRRAQLRARCTPALRPCAANAR